MMPMYENSSTHPTTVQTNRFQCPSLFVLQLYLMQTPRAMSWLSYESSLADSHGFDVAVLYKRDPIFLLWVSCKQTWSSHKQLAAAKNRRSEIARAQEGRVFKTSFHWARFKNLARLKDHSHISFPAPATLGSSFSPNQLCERDWRTHCLQY